MRWVKCTLHRGSSCAPRARNERNRRAKKGPTRYRTAFVFSIHFSRTSSPCSLPPAYSQFACSAIYTAAGTLGARALPMPSPTSFRFALWQSSPLTRPTEHLVPADNQPEKLPMNRQGNNVVKHTQCSSLSEKRSVRPPARTDGACSLAVVVALFRASLSCPTGHPSSPSGIRPPLVRPLPRSPISCLIFPPCQFSCLPSRLLARVMGPCIRRHGTDVVSIVCTQRHPLHALAQVSIFVGGPAQRSWRDLHGSTLCASHAAAARRGVAAPPSSRT